MGKILVGTSSWTAKGWIGPFYPEGTPRNRWLSHYATRFPTVEVDSTYYGIPRHSTVRGWADATPDDFVMSAKFPRSVVQFPYLNRQAYAQRVSFVAAYANNHYAGHAPATVEQLRDLLGR